MLVISILRLVNCQLKRIGLPALTINCPLLPSSPTLVTYWPAVDGGVSTIAPAEAADKKYWSPAFKPEVVTIPAVITFTDWPAGLVVSATPATKALSNVSFAIAFPTFPSLALEYSASPWVTFSKH